MQTHHFSVKKMAAVMNDNENCSWCCRCCLVIEELNIAFRFRCQLLITEYMQLIIHCFNFSILSAPIFKNVIFVAAILEIVIISRV